jgi:hypothetical protein
VDRWVYPQRDIRVYPQRDILNRNKTVDIRGALLYIAVIYPQRDIDMAVRGKTNNPTGRPKGTPNKKSVEVAEKLAALGCDPLEGMARIAKIAEAEQDYALAGAMHKELAQYVAPKRRAVEHTGADGASIDLGGVFEIVFK